LMGAGDEQPGKETGTRTMHKTPSSNVID
jgi:hypothetical protein